MKNETEITKSAKKRVLPAEVSKTLTWGRRMDRQTTKKRPLCLSASADNKKRARKLQHKHSIIIKPKEVEIPRRFSNHVMRSFDIKSRKIKTVFNIKT